MSYFLVHQDAVSPDEDRNKRFFLSTAQRLLIAAVASNNVTLLASALAEVNTNLKYDSLV